MHHQRIAAFLSGCLVLGSLFMIFVATQNFQTVDRVLASPPPEAAQMFQTLGPDNSRLLLRYLAGEENRLFFVAWEWAQMALGIALTAILLFAIRRGLLAGLAGGMVIIALFQHFEITPQMISVGRLIDFGAGAGSAAYTEFWRLHGLYGVLEVAKLVLVAAVAVLLFFWSAQARGHRHRKRDRDESTVAIS
jgi:nitroreductase